MFRKNFATIKRLESNHSQVATPVREPAILPTTAIHPLQGENKTVNMPVDTESKNVLYLSFDFDGCLSFKKFSGWPRHLTVYPGEILYAHIQKERSEFIQKYAKEIANEMFNNNKHLLEKIVKEAGNNYDKIVVMLGSNRQSFYRDFIAAYEGSGSAFPVLEMITEELKKLIKKTSPKTKVVFDKNTIDGAYWVGEKKSADKTEINKEVEDDPDISYEFCAKEYKKTGAELHDRHFEIIRRRKEGTRDDPEWLFDQQKISLIYYQIQRARKKNPNAKIDFHFYDDKLSEILQPLQEFFHDNPKLIPQGIKLHFHNYANGTLHSSNSKMVVGEGEPDPHYQDTLIALGGIILKDKILNDESSQQPVLVKHIPPENNFDFDLKDKKPEEIKARLTAVKSHVLLAARSSRIIGWKNVTNKSSIYTYTAEDLIKARQVSLIANTVTLEPTHASKQPPVISPANNFTDLRL